jgi:hypothetical protein
VSFKEKIKAESKTSATVGFVYFTAAYRSRATAHYILCESTADARFYDLALERGIGAKLFYFVPCNGKNGVLATRARIHKGRYDRKRVSAIIDKDHDDFINPPIKRDADIFVTEGYSVENYLISIEHFERVLRQFTGLQAHDPVIAVARQWYARLEGSFIEALADGMAIGIYLRRRLGADAVHFDKLEPHLFFRCVDYENFSVISSLGDELCRIHGVPKADEVRKKSLRIVMMLKARPPHKWIRGKYYSWWFIQAFSKITRRLCDHHNDHVGQPIKCGLNLGQAIFIAILAQHSVPPKALVRFFKGRL